MKKIYLLLLMFLSLMMLSSQANAAFLTVPEDDWLVKNIMTPLFDADNSPFSAVSKIFLGGVLAFGGLLATYTIVVGTMSTAHDGQALGKKWSSVWVPIRTVLGVALIVPIKNGFCGIQLIIVWLALQGIALADSAWDAYAKNPLQGAAFSAPALEPALKPVFIQAMQAGACQYSIQQYVNKIQTQGATTSASATTMNSGSITGINPQGMTRTGGSYATGITYNFGFSSNGAQTVNAQGICGSFTMPGGSTIGSAIDSAMQPAVAGNLVNMENMKEAIFNIQKEAMGDMLQKASDLGYQIAGSNDVNIDNVASIMNSAVSDYANKVAQEASNSFSSIMDSDGVDDMQKDGFISAGTWFYRIVKAQQVVTEQVSAIPLKSGMISSATTMFSGFDDKIKAVSDKIQKIGDVAKARTTNLSEDGASAEGMINYFINSSFGGTSFERMTENPLYAATNMGLKMIAGAGLAITAIIGAAVGGSMLAGNGVGKLAGTDTGVMVTAMFLSPLLSIAAGAILLPGIYLAIYLPMIPFIIWTGTVIGWLVLVVEALFAGPLWAMAHMAPDADGLVGRQGQGYMLIMSLILRPVLMVIGFVAAISMLKPAALFVNYFYAFTAHGSIGGLAGFVQIVGSIIVYCTLLNNLVKKILSMIHALPDAILQWIGGAGSNVLGQYGGGVESSTGSGFAQGFLGGAAGSAMTRGISRGADQSKERLNRVIASRRFGRAWSNQSQFAGFTQDEKATEMKRAYHDMYNNHDDVYSQYKKSGEHKFGGQADINFEQGRFRDYLNKNTKKK